MKGSKGSKAGWMKGAAFVALSVFSSGSWAGVYNAGKVFLTGGVFTIDGAGGGGAVPWATITGYESRDGINGGIGFTYVALPNYDLNFLGAAVGFFDLFELSYVNTKLSTDLPVVDVAALAVEALNLGPKLGLDPYNSQLHMETYGAKLRLFGDAIYTADSYLPQTALGVLYKVNSTQEFVHTLGADKTKDYELYLAFTKVFFRVNTLLNFTVRYTSANETGLTGFGHCDGFGNDRSCSNHKDFRYEGSLAYLLQKNFAIGGEFTTHGNNLNGRSVSLGETGDLTQLAGILPGLQTALTQKKESDWYDAFAAYAPNKNVSFTLAYLFLGNIAVAGDQNGFYLSTHVTF